MLQGGEVMDRTAKQIEYEAYYREVSSVFYAELEAKGINTSVANIKRVPEDIPIILTNQVEVIRCGKL